MAVESFVVDVFMNWQYRFPTLKHLQILTGDERPRCFLGQQELLSAKYKPRVMLRRFYL